MSEIYEDLYLTQWVNAKFYTKKDIHTSYNK